MRVTSEVLISFFESRREALDALALIATPDSRSARRTQAVVVSRKPNGSRSPSEPPAVPPFGALIGAGLGAFLGSVASEAGLVMGLFFGLYAGIFVDLYRTLDRGDLLDEIQDGLAPGQAALVAFVGGSNPTKTERLVASTDAVTAHRFPRVSIEDDFAREVGALMAELGRLGGADGPVQGEPVDRQRAIARARRQLSILEAIGGRLLSGERLQFGFEVGVLSRELEESPRWRAPQLRGRIRHVRASHRRARTTLEASTASLCAAEALAETMGRPAIRGRVSPS